MFSRMRVPEAFKKGLGEGINPTVAWKGFKQQAMGANDESIVLWPIRKLLEAKNPKLTESLRAKLWKHVSSKALLADMLAGKKLQTLPAVGKSLFTIKEDIPWGNKGLKKTISRASAMGPLVKTRDLAVPILVGVGLERGISALNKNRGPDMQNKQLREKAASVMLQLHESNKGHEKRAHALKLLFKQVELGYAQWPQTHSELETKLASLVTEDLVVLEKALEFAGGNIKLGSLGGEDPKASMGPEQKFRAVILGDEL